MTPNRFYTRSRICLQVTSIDIYHEEMYNCSVKLPCDEIPFENHPLIEYMSTKAAVFIDGWIGDVYIKLPSSGCEEDNTITLFGLSGFSECDSVMLPPKVVGNVNANEGDETITMPAENTDGMEGEHAAGKSRIWVAKIPFEWYIEAFHVRVIGKPTVTDHF